MRTRAFQRGAALETVQIEAHAGTDEQGAPSYDSPVSVQARAERVTEFITGPDGSEIRISLALWVPGDESLQPSERDRVTQGGDTFIVEAATDAVKLDGTLDHTDAMCRDEPS